MDIFSNELSAETPSATVTAASGKTPPGTWFCHEDVMVRMGPQKNPSPMIGKTVKKILPTRSGLEGQMSPNPTLQKQMGLAYNQKDA